MASVSETFAAPPGSAIRGVPPGCQEIPGYILDVFDGSAWITQDGKVTDKWHERGIWPTPEAAAEMMQRCLSPNNHSTTATITCDLLERLIETCQDWVGENDWRRNTTPKNILMMAETEKTISEARSLLWPNAEVSDRPTK